MDTGKGKIMRKVRTCNTVNKQQRQQQQTPMRRKQKEPNATSTSIKLKDELIKRDRDEERKTSKAWKGSKRREERMKPSMCYVLIMSYLLELNYILFFLPHLPVSY